MCGIVGCALSNTTVANNANGAENGSSASSSSSNVTVADNVAPILLESLTTLQHRGQGLFPLYFYWYSIYMHVYVYAYLL